MRDSSGFPKYLMYAGVDMASLERAAMLPARFVGVGIIKHFPLRTLWFKQVS